jgi:tetratricopeptide (TPR) repeat protein
VALHRRAGEAIEAIHGDHLDDHLPALSHHFAQACAGGNVTKAVDYAARAGERASVLLAHDEAVTYYRSALDLLEAAGASADDARRLPLLCALGKAQQRAGNPAHRETLLTAARLAGQHGDADTLTQAALANTRGHLPTQIGLVDNERVAMLEAAVTAIGDRGPASRARLLGTLGLELIFAGDWRRCLALSDEALALARDLGDPNTLARVLHTRHLPTSLPGFLAERLANTAELLNLVEVVGDPTLATDAYVLRCRAALEAGDVAEADKYLEAADRQARELNQPSLRFRVLYVRVGRLVVAGRFAEAETLLKEVAQLGQATGQGDAELMTAGQTFCIRRHTGRLDHETVTFLEQARPPSPVPMIDAMLAVIACELGQEDAARHALTSVTSSLPSFDIYWLSTMANWAWIASRLGETDSAEALHTLLAPYGEHHVPFLPWPSPSVAHHLGLLATTLRRFEEAEQQLAAANEIHERLGARHWVAETGLAEAEMRQARRGPGDTERARTLIDQALATATGLGASAIERWAAKLR